MLILPRSVFLMVPRAASTWCRQAIRNAGVKYKEHGPKHGTELPKNAPAFKFCILRDAEQWLRSRWTLGPWEDELTAEWDVDYAVFRSRVSDGMVRMYFNKYATGCQYVGKGVNVADELVEALRMAGEDFDEASLRDTPKINESPKSGDPIPEYFWKLKRDDLGKLPAEMIGRLPVDLLPRLPAGTMERLPAEVLAAMVARTTTAALQAAGAATVGGKR